MVYGSPSAAFRQSSSLARLLSGRLRLEPQRLAPAAQVRRGTSEVADERFLVLWGNEREPHPAAGPAVTDAKPVQRRRRRAEGVVRREHLDDGTQGHPRAEGAAMHDELRGSDLVTN